VEEHICITLPSNTLYASVCRNRIMWLSLGIMVYNNLRGPWHLQMLLKFHVYFVLKYNCPFLALILYIKHVHARFLSEPEYQSLYHCYRNLCRNFTPSVSKMIINNKIIINTWNSNNEVQITTNADTPLNSYLHTYTQTTVILTEKLPVFVSSEFHLL
jgi:hypothetical protein